MRKSVQVEKPSSSQAFIDFLLRRVPEWDAQILKDAELFVYPIIRDIRFLPNKLRAVYSMCHYRRSSFRKCAKVIGVSPSTVFRRYHKADSMISKKVNEWIKSLPKSKANLERERRRDRWVGHVNIGKFKGIENVWDGLDVYPKYESHDWVPAAPGLLC